MNHFTPSNNVPDATKGASDSVAAPGCVGVGGTIPQIYQDYMAEMATLWEMLGDGSFKNCREKAALLGGISAIKSLLLRAGFKA